MRTIRKERATRIVGIVDSENALELSGNGGVIPGVSPAVPLLPLPLPAVVGTFGLFAVCVVGVIVPPAVLKFASFKQLVPIHCKKRVS